MNNKIQLPPTAHTQTHTQTPKHILKQTNHNKSTNKLHINNIIHPPPTNTHSQTLTQTPQTQFKTVSLQNDYTNCLPASLLPFPATLCPVRVNNTPAQPITAAPTLPWLNPITRPSLTLTPSSSPLSLSVFLLPSYTDLPSPRLPPSLSLSPQSRFVYLSFILLYKSLFTLFSNLYNVSECVRVMECVPNCFPKVVCRIGVSFGSHECWARSLSPPD